MSALALKRKIVLVKKFTRNVLMKKTLLLVSQAQIIFKSIKLFSVWIAYVPLLK